MRRHLAYARYVGRHKWFVLQACRHYGVGWWQAIVHDWGKFLLSEWLPYARTFYTTSGASQYVESPEFAQAWNAHQKRHRHHWQAWLITWDRGVTEALPMPERFAREMLADWSGAGRAITGQPNPAAWYMKNRQRINLHVATRAFVESLLGVGAAAPREETPS